MITAVALTYRVSIIAATRIIHASGEWCLHRWCCGNRGVRIRTNLRFMFSADFSKTQVICSACLAILPPVNQTLICKLQIIYSNHDSLNSVARSARVCYVVFKIREVNIVPWDCGSLMSIISHNSFAHIRNLLCSVSNVQYMSVVNDWRCRSNRRSRMFTSINHAAAGALDGRRR